MFSNMFKKRTGNKKGSMLVLVLVIVAMALIFITSAVMLTNSSRSRFYDYTLSNQARITATSFAETICSALAVQDITDADLEGWATNKISATSFGGAIPGLNREAENCTTVSFKWDGDFIVMDVSTRIGSKANGTPVVENVEVRWKRNAPVTSSSFNNTLDIGNSCDISQFDVGYGAPAGKPNVIFAHGEIYLTKNAGNNKIYSDVVAVDTVHLANGGETLGSLIFAGQNAGLGKLSGSAKFNDIYFVNTEGGQGKVSTNNTEFYDLGGCNNVYLYNFNMNTCFRNVNPEYYTSGNNTAFSGGHNATAQASATLNVDNAEYQAKLDAAMARAREAIENKEFKTVEQASATFLEGISESSLTNRGAISDRTQTLEAYSRYTLPSSITGTITIDCSKGPTVLDVYGTVTISGDGCINVINYSDDLSTWPRIIIHENGTLNIGDSCSYSRDPLCGIVSSDRGNDGYSKNLAKPHMFIYGYTNSHVVIGNDGWSIDAYVGLYGEGSTIKVSGNRLNLCGRWEATNLVSENYNGGRGLPYCPGPSEEENTGKKPAVSKYDVISFQYYY